MNLSSASAKDLDKTIQELAFVTGREIKTELTAQMRLLCVDFAINTRPLEKGEAGKAKGESNIEAKVFAIYWPIGAAWSLLEAHKAGYGKAFVRMIKEGKYSDAAGFLSKYSRKKFEVGNFDGGRLHKDQAFQKGRVKNRMVVIDFNSTVPKYLKSVKKRVGYAKAGFATAARQLGGTRGIPGYASRHKSAPGTGSVTGDGHKLTVVITNGVKYAREALQPDKEKQALGFRKRQIDKVMKRIVSRRRKTASRSIK